jgi:hypothetical protein
MVNILSDKRSGLALGGYMKAEHLGKYFRLKEDVSEEWR